MITVLTDHDGELVLARPVGDQQVQSLRHRHSVAGEQQHGDDWLGREVLFLIYNYFIVTFWVFWFWIIVNISISVLLTIIVRYFLPRFEFVDKLHHIVRVTLGVFYQSNETFNVYEGISVAGNFLLFCGMLWIVSGVLVI